MRASLFILISLLSFGTSSAQQEPMVKTEFVSVALDDEVDGLFFSSDNQIKSFQANQTGLGLPVTYQGPQRFILRNSAAEFKSAPPLPPPAGSVTFPLNADRVLLVCLKSGTSPLKMIAYDISSSGVRPGDYRFFNFSKNPISIILSGERFAVASGKDTLVSKSSWRGDVLDLTMQAAIVENDKPKLVYSTVWGHRPGRRNFIFMFDSGDINSPIGFSRFFDIPSTAKTDSP